MKIESDTIYRQDEHDEVLVLGVHQRYDSYDTDENTGAENGMYRRLRRLPRGLTLGLKPTALYCLNLHSSVWGRWNVTRNCDNAGSSQSQKKSETALIWKKVTS